MKNDPYNLTHGNLVAVYDTGRAARVDCINLATFRVEQNATADQHNSEYHRYQNPQAPEPLVVLSIPVSLCSCRCNSLIETRVDGDASTVVSYFLVVRRIRGTA